QVAVRRERGRVETEPNPNLSVHSLTMRTDLEGGFMLRRSWLAPLCGLIVVLAVASFGVGGKGENRNADDQGTEKADTQSLAGKPAPDWSFPVLGNTKNVKLSELKGNVVMMDYWATWCPPCRASLPHVNDFANDKALAEKGLRVFAINDKETPDKAK